MVLACSRHLFVRPVIRLDQQGWSECHVAAFAFFAVPWRHVRYDNLSPAVARVLRGRNRAETARWLAFRSWYKSVPASSLADCSPGLLLAAS
jgi:transposase